MAVFFFRANYGKALALPRLIFVTPPPAGVKPCQKLLTLTPAGVSPRLAFFDPGQGQTPRKIVDPGPGRGLTPAGFFYPDPGRGFPGLNPGPRKTLENTSNTKNK